tara:strand:- start:87 stop:362 length:276 start_codon:yes stop_codon:yes gene_type:complete
VPAEEIFITSVPEDPYVPDQSPNAMHRVVLVELHCKVIFPGNSKMYLLAVKLIEGPLGPGTGAGLLESLPPPPPQEVNKTKTKKRNILKII